MLQNIMKEQGKKVFLNEDEMQEYCCREERRKIVERYDQGREEGAQIDDWEDPKNEIYHTTDR